LHENAQRLPQEIDVSFYAPLAQQAENVNAVFDHFVTS